MDKQGKFIESADIFLEKEIMDPKTKVNSLNSDPTFLQFSKLAPNPSLFSHSMPVNCDHFSNTPKSSLSITFVVTHFANDWARNFDKLK